MARIVYSDQIEGKILDFNKEQMHWLYNGLDAAITFDIWETLSRELMLCHNEHPGVADIYQFERALQGPALTMMLRGTLIDQEMRQELRETFVDRATRLAYALDRMAISVWGKGLNPRSHVQCKAFFYEHMKLPKQYKFDKGEKKLTVNREALERLQQNYYAMPIVANIMAQRDIAKKLETINAPIDEDGRMRTSYNVGATETGRWSSSESVFGTGTNKQNITDEMRRMFKPDPGYALVNLDLPQAESRVVAYASGDRSYIEACESGDLHTTVARMVWPELDWTGDPKNDRKVAEAPFYRHFSYRDMSKRGGHATNYYATAFTLSRNIKIPKSVAEAFQRKYFRGFKGIGGWHRTIQVQLQQSGYITTALGRRRYFLGRPWDDATLREAIAYEPQSIVGDLTNIGLYRIWREMDPEEFQILEQGHDAVLGQVKLDRHFRERVLRARDLMKTPVEFPSGTCVMDADISVGFNWGQVAKAKNYPNPDGLREWDGQEDLTRLDERFSAVY